MSTLITDIAENINAPDKELDAIIQSYLDGEYYQGPLLTVNEWKKENYSLLRQWAYPPLVDFIDAQVKIYNNELSEGNAQMSQYVTKCVATKTRFSKTPILSKEI